jgi:hypothetical protein
LYCPSDDESGVTPHERRVLVRMWLVSRRY